MSRKTSTNTQAVSGRFLPQSRGLKIVIICSMILTLLIIGFGLIPQPYYRDGFKTISDLQEFAGTLDEWIKMDGKNFLYPSYESYYQNKFTPSLSKKTQYKIQWILSSLGLQKKPIFSESFFDNILEEITETRQSNGLSGDFIQKIDLNENSKVVVFGPVQGAFHGLVRYLEKLHELEIIDENLKLVNPNYYMVFLGSVVNRSPYTLEIFSIVLKLLLKNPSNIIYLKGTQEFPDAWKSHSLDKEMGYRAHYTSKSRLELERTVDAFFNTLPITLYCTIPFLDDNGRRDYFKILPFIENEKLLNKLKDSRYATFLKQESRKSFITFDLSKSSRNDDPASDEISLRAILTGMKKRDFYEEMNGLTLLQPINGVIAWTILSSSAEPYRIGLHFFYDAFTVITLPGKRISISLYNRDVRDIKNKGFDKQSFDFFTGEPLIESN